MIWVMLFLLVALAILFVWPVLNQPAPVTAKAAIERELAASRTQLAQIEAEIETGFQDQESAGRARRAMERRILRLADRLDALENGTGAGRLSPFLKWGVPALIIIGTLGIYPLVGSPNYDPELPQTVVEIPPEIQDMSLADLEAKLSGELERVQSQDPVGYTLLARARMGLQDIDGAIEAYETALRFAGDAPQIEAELQQARTIKARLEAGAGSSAPALSDEQVGSFSDMSEAERNATIGRMVDGLAARLEDNPDDLNGWMRLIRARMVLGQPDEANKALETARTVFTADPDAIAALDALETELGSAEE